MTLFTQPSVKCITLAICRSYRRAKHAAIRYVLIARNDFTKLPKTFSGTALSSACMRMKHDINYWRMEISRYLKQYNFVVLRRPQGKQVTASDHLLWSTLLKKITLQTRFTAAASRAPKLLRQQPPPQPAKTCPNCEWTAHTKSTCPAAGKTCHSCNQLGHIKKMCRKAKKSPGTGNSKTKMRQLQIDKFE